MNLPESKQVSRSHEEAIEFYLKETTNVAAKALLEGSTATLMAAAKSADKEVERMTYSILFAAKDLSSTADQTQIEALKTALSGLAQLVELEANSQS